MSAPPQTRTRLIERTTGRHDFCAIMGGKQSRSISLSARSAEARLGPELQRVKAAFDGASSQEGMSEAQFLQVFCAPIPAVVARSLFKLFDANNRGQLSFD